MGVAYITRFNTIQGACGHKFFFFNVLYTIWES